MNDIDDILRTLSIPSTPTSQPQPLSDYSASVSSVPSEDLETTSEVISTEEITPSSSLSDEDLTDILESNGFYDEDNQTIDETMDDLADYDSDNDDEEEDEDDEEDGFAILNATNRTLTVIDDEGSHTTQLHDIDALAEELRHRIEEEDWNGEEERNTPNEALPEDNSSQSSAEELSSSVRIDEEALIPLNSPTLLIDESTTRFSGTEWYNEIQKSRIILAGIGGIGSNVAFQLARMIPASITLYDDDDVEIVNMAGQLFSRLDIGKSKVDAIADMIHDYTSMQQVFSVKGKFTSNTEPGDIMICGFDNMKARYTFFHSWLKHVQSLPVERRTQCLFLDGRLSIDTLQILCIQGHDSYNIERYKQEFLFSDSEADATVCSMKQTTYLACMIGSFMVNLFTNFIANSLDPIIPYDLPFFTEYDAQNMIFKTEN